MIADLHGGLAVDAESRLDAFLSAMQDKDCHALIQMGDFAFPKAKHQVFADKFNAANKQTIASRHGELRPATIDVISKACGLSFSMEMKRVHRRIVVGIHRSLASGSRSGWNANWTIPTD